MPIFDFKRYSKLQGDFKRDEPIKGKSLNQVEPYIYVGSYPYMTPYASIERDKTNTWREMIRRGGAKVIPLHERIPFAKSYRLIDPPYWLRLEGTVLYVDDIPNNIQDAYLLKIEVTY